MYKKGDKTTQKDEMESFSLTGPELVDIFMEEKNVKTS